MDRAITLFVILIDSIHAKCLVFHLKLYHNFFLDYVGVLLLLFESLILVSTIVKEVLKIIVISSRGQLQIWHPHFGFSATG